MQYPLSQDEHAAMARCLAGIRQQLQDVSDLFAGRYGQDSRIAERAAEAVISVASLEKELLIECEIASVQTQLESIGTTA
ncbi:MAG: hypothetical protein ACR2IV_20295 [Bryobacteraceae bacterium]